MTWIAAWRLAKPFLPYIAAGLAVIALLLWIDHRGYQRGFHRRDAEVARITRDRDTHASNERILQGALDQQNAALAQLQSDSAKRMAEGSKALAAAEKANRTLNDQAEALRKSAKLKYGKDDPCVISETLARTGKI